jgi:voltage-gated potassium channel
MPSLALRPGHRQVIGEENAPSEKPNGIVARLLPLLLPHERTAERLLATLGLAASLIGTMPGTAARYDGSLTFACLAVAAIFALQYARRLYRSPDRIRWIISGSAVIDLLAAAPVPLALILDAPGETARLFGIFWSLKLIGVNPAFALLGRVLQSERQPLLSVTMAFAVVLLFAATAAFLAEHAVQPEAFASIPAALWWAVTTITTTGYGDKIPLSLAGRLLAGAVMVSGIGLFALWAGILASGFSQELRRRDFLESWDLVVRLPLFRDLGAAALAEISRLLKVQRCPADSLVVRQGQPGDSMFFIAEGEVEVRAGNARIRLGPGQFFGEMALLTGGARNADVVALAPTRLLRLDVVEFRGLAARLPELLRIIETESARRAVLP